MLKKRFLPVFFAFGCRNYFTSKIDSIDIKACVLTINGILMIRLIPLF